MSLRHISIWTKQFFCYTVPEKVPLVNSPQFSPYFNWLYMFFTFACAVWDSELEGYSYSFIQSLYSMAFQGLVSLLFPLEAFEPVRIYFPNFLSPHLWAPCNTGGRCYHLYIILRIAKCTCRACLVELFDLPACVKVPSTWWFYCKLMGRKVINSSFLNVAPCRRKHGTQWTLNFLDGLINLSP